MLAHQHMLALTPTHASTHTNLSALDAKLLLKEPLPVQELPDKGLSARYVTILNKEQWQSLHQIFNCTRYLFTECVHNLLKRNILKWYKAVSKWFKYLFHGFSLSTPDWFIIIQKKYYSDGPMCFWELKAFHCMCISFEFVDADQSRTRMTDSSVSNKLTAYPKAIVILGLNPWNTQVRMQTKL